MDDSWLFINEEIEEADSLSDEEEKDAELEERLYAIIHHNDLSQPLPPELAKHYNIQHTGSGELEVSFKNTLKEIQTEENEKIRNLFNNADANNETDVLVDESNVTPDTRSNDDVLVISNDNDIAKQSSKSFKTSFRYSDVNIVSAFSSEVKEIQPTSNDVNYFQLSPGVFKKRNKKFANLKIPSLFTPSDWKTDANASFISIGSNSIAEKEDIIQKMTQALLKINPGEKTKNLSAFAHVLYQQNVTRVNKRRKKRASRKMRKQLTDQSLDFDSKRFRLSQELSNCSKKHSDDIYESSFLKDCKKFSTPQHITNKCESKARENGSISLNISPFRPSIPPMIDLVSDEENSTLSGSTFHTPKRSKINYRTDQETMSNSSHLPLTWTKKMKKYYTKPMKEEYKIDIGPFIEHLKRTSTAKNWSLDPRDQLGVYDHQLSGKQRNRRCTNCRERGHTIHKCTNPIKEMACTLCGQLYHSNYTCPNMVCMKCGVYTSGNAYQGECNVCYYSTLDGDPSCTICSERTHRSVICPDLWRSFHATTGGEKRVPEKINVNKRKYCCNCARKGHFSHECPFLMYSGQQISPFVKNYSAESSEKGRIDFNVSKNDSNFNTEEGDNFLQHLSNNTEAIIVYNEDYLHYSFNIEGTFEQCSMVKKEIENFVNISKRKRHEPPLRGRKRQRV